MALVGFMDDRAALAARWRFLAHSGASIASLWAIGGIPLVPVFGVDVDLGWFGLTLAAIYLIWMVNLYNFMDGIDAIAAIEAITVSPSSPHCAPTTATLAMVQSLSDMTTAPAKILAEPLQGLTPNEGWCNPTL